MYQATTCTCVLHARGRTPTSWLTLCARLIVHPPQPAKDNAKNRCASEGAVLQDMPSSTALADPGATAEVR